TSWLQIWSGAERHAASWPFRNPHHAIHHRQLGERIVEQMLVLRQFASVGEPPYYACHVGSHGLQQCRAESGTHAADDTARFANMHGLDEMAYATEFGDLEID